MIRGVSGARGREPGEFTAAACLEMSAAFGALAGEGPVVVGRDTRPSGVMAAHAVAAGLLGAGRPVIDLGVAPTPAVEFAVPRLSAAGGVIITASHNPAGWNGLKFLDRQGLFLAPEASRRVYAPGAAEPVAASASWSARDILPGYLEAVAALVDRAAIARRRFRVVVDAVNGAAWAAGPQFLERLGADVVPLHCEPGGGFPRDPEPRPENLGLLEAAVSRSGADLGLAFDPDGDRLCLVSEEGRALSEEFTLALCVRHYLARGISPVVINQSTSLAVEGVARELGAPVRRTPVGEFHVAREMLASGAAIGGEGNGGVIVPACHPGRDGFVAAALVLEYLAASGQPLSRLAARLPAFFMHKEKLPRPDLPAALAGERLSGLFPGAALEETDGLRFSGPGWWVQVRASNTEPVFRLIVETETPERTASLAGKVRGVLSPPERRASLLKGEDQ